VAIDIFTNGHDELLKVAESASSPRSTLILLVA
jgi:hypothetical protein